MTVADEELLALHAALVEIPSVSHAEQAISAFVLDWLAERGVQAEAIGRNVVATSGGGAGPRLLLNSHLDTVPAGEAWTRPPHVAAREGDRVFGLGSNDAKAAVACMLQAFVRAHHDGVPGERVLMLVADEETGGEGTELAWPAVAARGFTPDGVVVGEPTGLDVAACQRGLLILELEARGDACHAANARALEARNAVFALARDVTALEAVDLGPPHPELGATTLEPTLLRAGVARNMLPDAATCALDLRTVPGQTHADLVARVRGAVQGTVNVRSDRLVPVACPAGAAILDAAHAARAEARIFASRTMSDMVFFAGLPVIKCGPGRSERSHTPDEFVLVEELLTGRAFYSDLITAFCAGERAHESAVGQG